VKILKIVLLASILSISISAKSIDSVYAGYSVGSVSNKFASGPTVGWINSFDTINFEHALGVEFNFLGSNKDVNDGTGNTGFVYTSTGYKIQKDLVLYALLGISFQNLGSNNLSGGIGYGIGTNYKFDHNLAIDFNYKTYVLEDVNNYRYDIRLATTSIVFSF
jgi:hypothetical protein